MAMLSMVGVISVDMHTASTPPSFAVPAMVAGGTSLPRSLTISPPAVSMVLTMFFPMSWTSPCTTAVMAVLLSDSSSFGIAGIRTSRPSYMAWAATRTWGRYMVWLA